MTMRRTTRDKYLYALASQVAECSDSEWPVGNVEDTLRAIDGRGGTQVYWGDIPDWALACSWPPEA